MEDKITLTKEEFEKEIQLRVEFKFKEFESALKNRVGFKFQKAFDMTKESNLEYNIWKEINEMIGKEVSMPVPWNDFKVLEEKRQRKNKAVDNIMNYLRPKLMGRVDERGIPSKLANEIERAQL